MIIEGDNLEALSTLAYTHAGKIDVIYIDPPYNTGNKDFIYNDSYVDSEDSYRHSKWLSFMSKRLRIAKKLLSDRGVIFISIDDNEQANLKLLCDEIFGLSNCVGTIPTVMNLKGNQAEYGFAGTHEYTIVYVKNKTICTLGNLVASDEEIETWTEDEIGYYKKGATLKRTGTDAPRMSRPYGYFPILVDKKSNTAFSITNDEYRQIYNPVEKSFDDEFVESLRLKYIALGYVLLLPIVNEQKCSWRWGFNTVQRNLNEIIVNISGGEYSLYKKQRPELGEIPSKKPKSILYKATYSSGNGTAQLKDLGLNGKFNNPKPIDLIIDLLRIGNGKCSTILDFFAGSGTTLHAVMQLNAEDGGKRTCILCTNNENGICENVTYERNKRVINGYTKPNGEAVEGLHNNNLRYYRTAFVGRSRSVQNMRRLVNLSTDMLCIKEDLYTEKKQFAGQQTYKGVFRFFDDGKKQMLVIYREEVIAELVPLIATTDYAEPIKVYVFSPSEDPWEADFEDVADKVQLCALPQAIYNTYKRILPKPKDRNIAAEEQPTEPKQDNPGGLFDFTEEGGEA
ncbi:MAG: site-specific DNA-methyltransferase [Bacteroidales bacterium]|nr:site-specific DNA-methyltransferase [Bacteroidales bacterium]